MPIDPNDPANDPNSLAYMDPAAIKNRMTLASSLTQRATQPFAPHWSGILAAGLTGAHGGLERAGAEAALSNNQRLTNEAFRNAAGAKDNVSMSQALLKSGIPGLGEKGLDVMVAERNRAAQQNTPAALLDLEYKRAAIDKMRRGDEPEIARTLRAAGIDPSTPEGKAMILRSIKGNDPVSEAINGVIQRALKGEAAPTGGVMPQSSTEGGVPQTGMIPVADGAQSGVIPTQSATAQPAEASRGGLFPNMSPADKRTLGQAMLANKQTEALGKALLEEGNADALGKEARNEVDKKELNTTELLSRLNVLSGKFKPEYQTFDEQLKQYGASWLDAIGPLRDRMSPEARQKLADYTTYRQDALNNINQYIKEITGAAMTDGEAKRIMAAAPNPLSDSPTQFEAKLNNIRDQSRLAIARYRFLRKNGFKGDATQAENLVSLDKMRNTINGRATQLYQQLKSTNPAAPEADVRRQVKEALRADFGIDA